MNKVLVDEVSRPDRTTEPTVPRAFPKLKRSGPFVFISGTSTRRGNMTTGDDIARDIRSQTVACIDDIRAELEEIGGGLENLVEITTYLINISDYGGYNEIYGKHFPPNGPARTTVAVHQLPLPNQLIEIRATAYIAQDEQPK